MFAALRRSFPVLLAVPLLAAGGCTLVEKIPTPAEMLHNLKPHRLSHLNRGPKLGRDHADFSVADVAFAEQDAAAGKTEDRPDRLDVILNAATPSE